VIWFENATACIVAVVMLIVHVQLTVYCTWYAYNISSVYRVTQV